MSAESKWKVGQTVLEFASYRRSGNRRELIVTKIGRTHFEASSQGDPRFATRYAIADGYTKGRHAYVMTPEDVAKRDERHAAIKELRDLGVEGRMGANRFEEKAVEILAALKPIMGGSGE